MKLTIIAENVRSFFEINFPFESKHDRTQLPSNMIREMIYFSIVNRGPPILSSQREHHLHIEGKVIVISKRKTVSSFQNERGHHFKTIVLPVINLRIICHQSA